MTEWVRDSSSFQSKDLRFFLKIPSNRWPGTIPRVNIEPKAFDLADCGAVGCLFKVVARASMNGRVDLTGRLAIDFETLDNDSQAKSRPIVGRI